MRLGDRLIAAKVREEKKTRKRAPKMSGAPQLHKESYASYCFSKKYYKRLSSVDPKKITQAFDDLWKEIKKQAVRGGDPSFQLLDGPGATLPEQLRMAAIVQDHEAWQRFVQKCKDNNLGMEFEDFSDDHGFNIKVYFFPTK